MCNKCNHQQSSAAAPKPFFITHNDAAIQTDGTSFMGAVDRSYAELEAAFGTPGTGDEYKSGAHWSLLFEDGTVATVYNYKDGKNYLGDDGLPTEEIRDWHIGGFNYRAVELVKQVLFGG
jgi:hypothetical protein